MCEQKPCVINTVCAWLSLLAGYLFCCVVPVHSHPFGAFLFIILMFAAATVYLKLKNASFDALTICVAASAVIMSLSLLFSANGFLHTISYLYALSALTYYIYSAFGNRLKDGFNDFIVWDFVKALFILPLAAVFEIFRTLFTGKTKVSAKAVLKITFGLTLAIIPTAIVVALLSYDSGFTNLLQSIFAFDINEIFSHIISIIFGVPVAMCIYSLLMSAQNNRCENIITVENLSNTSNNIKALPALSSLGAVIPMLFVYVIFFISQWKYYISAFIGEVSDNINISSYARNGFFELCGVTVLNLVIIAALALIVRGKTIKRILTTVLSVFTLVLIATAISKMVLYIDRYGLTRMRVYPLWFMIVLVLVFAVIIIKQFYRPIPALAAVFAIAVISFSALSVCNVDGIIANYNVDRYLDGTLEQIDIYSLEKMGDAAVPALYKLKDECFNNSVSRDAQDAIEYIEAKRNDSIWSFTIPRAIANKNSFQQKRNVVSEVLRKPSRMKGN